MQHEEVKFSELNSKAQKSAMKQMVEIHKQGPIYDISTEDEFAKMIAGGYNPDKDFMFLQYLDDSLDNVTVYLKDFS